MSSHFRLLEVPRTMPGADVGGLLRSGVISLCLAAGVLHVSAEGARATLRDGLESLGAQVEEVPVYRSVPDRAHRPSSHLETA